MIGQIKEKIRKNNSREIRKFKHWRIYQALVQNWVYFRSKERLKEILEEDLRKEKRQMQSPKKVAIIFQGTKNYVKMFPHYYNNLKKYFIPNTRKDFFVLTDMIDFDFFKGKEDVIPVYQEHDDIVMLRAYEHMLKVKDKLKKYDQIIWLDADMWLEEFLYEDEFFCHDKPLFGVTQPNFLVKEGSFEKNPDSLAYVGPEEDKSIYIQACFWGGRSKEALELTKELDRRIKKGLSQGSVAKLEDEAHLNKYRIENSEMFYVYPPSYAYPPNRRIPRPFIRKIFHGKKKDVDIFNH